uniref:hypothetical protein n=1 Tax=Candidatus Venteria ishoeyi TaxID=1899563 RepID=UPI00387E869B
MTGLLATGKTNEEILKLYPDLEKNANKPSVIQLRMENILPSVMGNMVVEALNSVSKALKNGTLVTIDPKRHRIRLLPLRH